MEDNKIVALYNARDSNALHETNIKYGKLCYMVANDILHCREDSEECVNDTYLTAWNTIPPEQPKHLSAYLCCITRNLSLKKYEYAHAKKRNADLEISISELEEILTDRKDILHEIECRELGETINRFLRSLPIEERNVFIRRYWLFNSIKMIATDFSYSQSKIKSMLSRTRKKLGIFLDTYYKIGD